MLALYLCFRTLNCLVYILNTIYHSCTAYRAFQESKWNVYTVLITLTLISFCQHCTLDISLSSTSNQFYSRTSKVAYTNFIRGGTVQTFNPAPGDRSSASGWLYKHLWITCQKSQAYQSCGSELRSVVRLSMHPCPRNGGNRACARVLCPGCRIKCMIWMLALYLTRVCTQIGIGILGTPGIV